MFNKKLKILIIFCFVALSIFSIKILKKKYNVSIKILKKKYNVSHFTIRENGAWAGIEATQGHVHDKSIEKALINFFKKEHATSIIDLGAGKGDYTKSFIKNNLFASCYDGNLETQDLSKGVCGIIDLAKDINFAKYDWVLSLEVAEHLPVQYEDIFINNLDKLNKKGIVLSWALEGQGGDGHVNEKNNNYVKEKFKKLGYLNDVNAENKLRNATTNAWWFKKTIMVFRKK